MEDSHASRKHLPQPTPRLTVFFDGQCPLCRREIAHYRRRKGSETIDWIDITRDPERLTTHGLGFDAAMARFHVRDGTGRWHTGAAAFAELWSQLSGYRWLARGLRALGVLPTLDRLYTRFARRRLRHRGVKPECTRCAGAFGPANSENP